jgi:hypothetical protein
MNKTLKCLLVGFFILWVVMPAYAVNNYKVSNYGGGHQIWFEAEAYDERNPDTNQYFQVVDQAGAFGKAITRAGGAGGMIRWTFDISLAGGKGGTWYFWGRVISPNNQSDFMLVEGDPHDTVIPAGPPFPGNDGTPPFVTANDRVFEYTTTSWTWILADHSEGHTKVLQNGKNTMRIYHRQGDNTVFWDTFVWADSASYVPTDDDYRNARAGGKAGNPNPANGTIGVTIPLLQWTPSASAVFHDVYFGTDPNNMAKVATHQPFALYYHLVGFQPGTTYYWRVDEIEADGVTVQKGDVWTFSSEPLKDYLPAPADAAAGQLPGLVLTWKAGKDATKHQVYFGTDSAAVASGAASVDKGKVTDLKFDSGALRASTTYYWRVDAVKADGSSVKGDVWSFSTADAGPANKIEAQVWLNIGSGTTVPDLTGNARYPSSPDTTQYLDSWLYPPGSSGASDTADNYGDRLFGWLKPDQTGDYTFWIAGDDQSQLWLSTDGSPTNGKMIAQVTGWTNAMDWDGTTGSTTVAALKSAPQHLEAGKKYFIMTLHKEGGGGDSVGVAWQGPGIASRQLLPAKNVDVFYLAPLQAFGPTPANGAVDTAQSLTLSWMAGDKAQKHEVYLGTDKAAVAAADSKSPLFMGSQAGTSYSTGALQWGKTYYWRVDETNTGEADSPWKGAVWSFTTANFIPIDDFESYTDAKGNEIFSTWIDGFTNGLSGSTVGNLTAPFAERTIVHGGKQSMPMDYNNIKSPFYSEAELDFAPVQNWTGSDVNALSLWVRGYPAVTSVAVTETAGKMTLTGDGTDIWGNSDEFTFAYKTLTGDGSLVARVVDKGTGTNTWAKAGVMIRDSLDGGSTHVSMDLSANTDGTAGNGYSFQWRPVANGASSSADGTAPAITVPYWVKIQRVGDNFTGYLSADGKTWRQWGTTQTIVMTAPVYIGLCVTSHASGEQRTSQFDSIATTGNVTGSWQGALIASPRYNGAASLYVIVEDSAGKNATATNATAVNAIAWTQWKIPLSSFTGVNLGKVKKLYIGVGDRKNPVADGSGRIYIDDIQVTK